MFGSQALETVTGLVFFFLAISIFVTSVQEFIATALALRSSTLDKGLQQLVGQGQDLAKYGEQLLAHPNVSPSRSKAYVSADDFCSAMIGVLSSDKPNATFDDVNGAIANLPDGPLKTAATTAAKRAQGRLDEFEKQLSTWFDSSMDNLSSKYKRLSGYISLGLGVILAFALNLDALRVVKVLWTSEALREQAAAAAAAEVAKGLKASSFIPKDASLGLFDFHINWCDPNWTFSGVAFLGCAITAFAVGLGAPFWFDMLQNVMNLRGAAKPASAGT